MKQALLIPSRHRPNMVTKVQDRWLASGLDVYLFIEPQDEADYWWTTHEDVNVITLEADDRGIGWARQQMLDFAMDMGYCWPVFCDDDILVPPNLHMLAESAEDGGLAGVGAHFRIYNHFLGLEEGTGTHAVTGGMGTQCFALNATAATRVGGFDERLATNLEDSDLILRLIAAGYGPWAVNTDVEAGHLGTRYQPGGISSLPGDNHENLRRVVEYLSEKHPGIVTMTAKGGSRIAWKKHYLNHGYDWPLELF